MIFKFFNWLKLKIIKMWFRRHQSNDILPLCIYVYISQKECVYQNFRKCACPVWLMLWLEAVGFWIGQAFLGLHQKVFRYWSVKKPSSFYLSWVASPPRWSHYTDPRIELEWNVIPLFNENCTFLGLLKWWLNRAF